MMPVHMPPTEAETVLIRLSDLAIGESFTLPARPQCVQDGFGGLTVKRYSRNTFIFQRELSRYRSRWADSLGDALYEIEYYLLTGALREPDKVLGF